MLLYNQRHYLIQIKATTVVVVAGVAVVAVIWIFTIYEIFLNYKRQVSFFVFV